MAEISSDATADIAAFEKARRTVRLSKAIMLAVLVVNSMAGAALILSSTFFSARFNFSLLPGLTTLLTGIAAFSTLGLLLLNSAISAGMFRPVSQYLPGKVGTVKKTLSSARYNCIVSVEGLAVKGYCQSHLIEGTPVSIINVVATKNFSSIVKVNVEPAGQTNVPG